MHYKGVYSIGIPKSENLSKTSISDKGYRTVYDYDVLCFF
jgi:hypothetical protein